MAQINLLKQKTDSSGMWTGVIGMVAKLLIVVLVAVLGYYVWLYTKTKQTNNDILSLEQKITQNKSSALANKDRSELLTRQQQLNELDSLLTSHVYWSGLMPALAKVTLKTAAYSSLRATADGNLVMTASLPSLQDLDKFLQVFDQPQFNENFSNIRIGAFNESPEGNTKVVRFDVKMTFNPALLKK